MKYNNKHIEDYKRHVEFRTPKGLSPDVCWNWIGGKSKAGYGIFRGYPGVATYAHIASYLVSKGEIKEGEWVLHKCNNRACVNPNHLYLGSPQDNANDRGKAGNHTRGVMMSIKLKDEDIKEIRRLHKETTMSQKEIGLRYNIDQSQISRILNRKRWSHII